MPLQTTGASTQIERKLPNSLDTTGHSSIISPKKPCKSLKADGHRIPRPRRMEGCA